MNGIDDDGVLLEDPAASDACKAYCAAFEMLGEATVCTSAAAEAATVCRFVEFVVE
jgi:hypothetical protein